MSANVAAAAAGDAPRSARLAELLECYEKLPERDKKLFTYGPVYLAGNGALAGLVSNSLYRRALNVTQGRVTSSVPMAVLPFLTTYALYNAAVSAPLLSGDLNCPTCVLLRGALVGVAGGALYPLLLALPVNAGLASRYSTAPMPEKGNVLRFWTELSRPILRKMRAVVVLQALFGTYLGSRNVEVYAKILEIASGSGEELRD